MIVYEEITNLDKMKTGDHIVLLYNKTAEILSASVSFIKTSLDRNEKCLYISGDLDEEILLNEIKKQIPNLDLYIENGQLQFLRKEETYALSNKFKAEAMIEKLKEESMKALEEGYEGLSITGELSWVLNFEDGKKEIIDYEWMLNKYIFNDYPVVAMCRYNLDKFDNSIIKAVIELHHYIIWQGEIHENPYYIDPEGYRNNQIVEYEIESWLNNIKKYKKSESVFKEKLKKSENKYKNLFNEAPIGIFQTTVKGEIISINKSMAEILGFSSIQEALEHYDNLKISLYFDPKRRDEFIKVLNNRGEVKNFEYEALGKNKEHKWISMNARKRKKINENDFLIEGFAFDITERKNREEKIKNQKEELSASYEKISAYNEEVMAMNEELEKTFEEVNLLNQRFVNMIELVSNIGDKTLLDEEEFFSDLLKDAVEIIPEADYGKICLIDDQDQCKFIDAIGHDINILEKIKFDKNLLFHRESKTVNNTNDYFFDIDQIKTNKEDFLKALKPIKDSLYINIIIDRQIIGRIGLDIKEESRREFSDISKKVLESFSTLASSFFAFKRFDDLQTNFTKELITSIIKIMEMYDLYTKGHSENVAKLASAIAKEMNLSKKIIKDTYWAGLVHDIGKLLIPLNIINKKEDLTDKEFNLIKKHPVWGYQALSSSKILKPIAEYLLFHHERWDGRGYPQGLTANEIPLISQILAVADAWDAMLSKRAYRNSLSFEKAIEELKTNKGTQFSPQAVDAFIKIIENDKIEKLQQEVLDNEINKSKSKELSSIRNEDYEELFIKAEEGIVILDEDFNIIRANNYFIKMFKYDKQNIIGEDIKKIVPVARIEETKSYIHKLSQGESINSKTIRKKDNGEMIKVSIQAFPVSLNGGNMGYYVIYKDITELEETKSKYKNIKDRYKALFENENTVMLIIDPENGEIVDANPAAEIFYGWSKEILTSMKISDINVLNKKEVEKEMEKAKEKNQNYFNFKHRISNDKIKNVEVYSQPIPFTEKEYLYSIIHEKLKS